MDGLSKFYEYGDEIVCDLWNDKVTPRHELKWNDISVKPAHRTALPPPSRRHRQS